MSDTAAISNPAAMPEITGVPRDSGEAPARRIAAWARAPLTAIAVVLSSYFFIAAFSLYWLTAIGAAIGAFLVPRRLIEKGTLIWLTVAWFAVAALTQGISGFFPDYTQPREIVAEIAMWLALGLAARAYLVYTEHPETFAGLRHSIEERPLDRWFAKSLLRPIDAVFTRIGVANTLALVPVTVVLVLPSTVNYLALAAYGTAAMLIQFPQDLMDHANIHNRIFTPRNDASPRVKRILRACQIYYENVECLLALQIPQYYRIQHNYVHHVEDNGPADSQTTLPYDRMSFFDFARHALRQGIDLVTGWQVFRYLAAKGKHKQIRELARGIVIWYAVLALIAVFNPIAAAMVFFSRFVGGNILSLFSFWQHGLIDEHDVHDVHGNSTDFAGSEHGNLGHDYHVEHHLRPGRHWADYYEQYAKAAAAEGGHKALVMDKDAFGPLTFVAALWRKDADAIARYGRIQGIAAGDQASLAELVRERTRPVGAEERTGLAARADAIMGQVMAVAMPKAFRV